MKVRVRAACQARLLVAHSESRISAGCWEAYFFAVAGVQHRPAEFRVDRKVRPASFSRTQMAEQMAERRGGGGTLQPVVPLYISGTQRLVVAGMTQRYLHTAQDVF